MPLKGSLLRCLHEISRTFHESYAEQNVGAHFCHDFGGTVTGLFHGQVARGVTSWVSIFSLLLLFIIIYLCVANWGLLFCFLPNSVLCFVMNLVDPESDENLKRETHVSRGCVV